MARILQGAETGNNGRGNQGMPGSFGRENAWQFFDIRAHGSYTEMMDGTLERDGGN